MDDSLLSLSGEPTGDAFHQRAPVSVSRETSMDQRSLSGQDTRFAFSELCVRIPEKLMVT